ncbi:MAG: hypothetical protein K6C36_04580 [Clostridia bacterium]|nr:hypothetical protein [Clostridia bacterium]
MSESPAPRLGRREERAGWPGGFLYAHRFLFFFFVYVVLYNYVVVTRFEYTGVNWITYPYFLVDYRTMGFRSQLLPGSVFYGIFGERSNEDVAAAVNTALLLVIFFGIALLLERFVKNVGPGLRSSAVLLAVFYLSGMFTFSIFTDLPGMLDVYWVFFSVLFFVFLKNRLLRWLIPALYVLSMLIHFSSVIGCIILFSIVLLYEIASARDRKSRTVFLVVFALSMLSTILVFGYFLIHNEDGLPMTLEEFDEMLLSRGGKYTWYYDYAFYNIHRGKEVVPSSVFAIESPVLRIVSTVRHRIIFNIGLLAEEKSQTFRVLSLSAMILVPAAVFYYRRLLRFFGRLKGEPLKRFCVFLMMVQVPVTAAGCLFSVDLVRWLSHAFLIAFTLLLYLLYNEPNLRSDVLGDVKGLRSSFPFAVYALAYFFSNARAYG